MPHPLLYEVNTRCWLRALSEKSGSSDHARQCSRRGARRMAEARFHAHLADGGVDHWPPRARGGVETSRTAPSIRPGPAGLAGRGCRRLALRDCRLPSPAALGGEAGLAAFRQRLHGQGLKLVLDFVPNHLGLDHPWVRDRPDLFVQSPTEVPGNIRAGNRRRACAGWPTAKTPTSRRGRTRSNWIIGEPPRGRR